MKITDEPIVLTPYALVRYLKEFGLKAGLSESFAGALAQMHVYESTIPERWDTFIQHNCTRCPMKMDNCSLLHPRPEQCRGKSTPQSLRHANAFQIESGRYRECPVLAVLEERAQAAETGA